MVKTLPPSSTLHLSLHSVSYKIERCRFYVLHELSELPFCVKQRLNIGSLTYVVSKEVGNTLFPNNRQTLFNAPPYFTRHYLNQG